MAKTGNNYRFIHFFGPDGSGKSTHVEILVRTLRRHGVKVQKCWVRAPHTIAFLLWRLLVKIGFYREVLNPYGDATKIPAVNRGKLLSFFWSVVELLGVLPHILRVHYYLWRGRTLIAERYILDSIATIAYFLDDIQFIKSWIAKFLIRLIPKGTIFIFLDADYETIYKRRSYLRNSKILGNVRRREYGATPASGVEPRAFINFQRVVYKFLSSQFKTLYINTSETTIEQTSMLIRRYLGLN